MMIIVMILIILIILLINVNYKFYSVNPLNHLYPIRMFRSTRWRWPREAVVAAQPPAAPAENHSEAGGKVGGAGEAPKNGELTQQKWGFHMI